MGTNKVSNASSDRQKWNKVFNALVHMLQTQQTQLESLVKERKLLEGRIRLHYDRWVSDVRLLEDQISQMGRDLVREGLARSLDAAKCDLVVGLKQREASVYKLKLDHADSELTDLKVWLDYLSQKCPNPKEISGGDSMEIHKGKERGRDGSRKSAKNNKEEERHSEILDSLLMQNDFVWNQYRLMERDYTNKLESRCVEVEQANEKVEKLLVRMEELQSLNKDKDDTIVTLETKLAKMEDDTSKRNEEISRLSQELELLRKSRSSSVTPVLNRCMAKPRISGFSSKNIGSNRINVYVKKEPPASRGPDQLKSKDSEKGTGSLKRKAVHVIPISETPKLFSSDFKVPKLKKPSPLVR